MEEKSLKEECRLDENVIIEIPWRVDSKMYFYSVHNVRQIGSQESIMIVCNEIDCFSNIRDVELELLFSYKNNAASSTSRNRA